MARERVSTGIEGLDHILRGGLPQGKSYLITGEPGTGKTTFSAQFMLEGLKNDENGIYISVDEKPVHVVEDAESLGWDLRTPVEAGRLTLLDVSPYFNWVRQGKNNAIDTAEVIHDLSKQIRRINAKRLIFDSIVPLVLHRERVHDVQEFIRELIFSIDDNLGCTTLMTSHIWPGAIGQAEHSVEEFLVSGVIQLRLVKANEGRYKRAMFVRKMRATPVELREYVFEIEHGRGLVVKEPLTEAELMR